MKIKNIDKMRERHKKEIEHLQELCHHENISDWTEYMWAVGHYGSPVKYCLFCGKIIEQRKENTWTVV
jgi:hypothetical protein